MEDSEDFKVLRAAIAARMQFRASADNIARALWDAGYREGADKIQKRLDEADGLLKRVNMVLFRDTKTEAFSWAECPLCHDERKHDDDCPLGTYLDRIEAEKSGVKP